MPFYYHNKVTYNALQRFAYTSFFTLGFFYQSNDILFVDAFFSSYHTNDNLVIVPVQSQKHISQHDMFESIEEMLSMRRKLKGQCPCGYSFEILGSISEAISVVRIHVDSFHKDFLPFGITNDEALELLNQDKPKISANTRLLQCI